VGRQDDVTRSHSPICQLSLGIIEILATRSLEKEHPITGPEPEVMPVAEGDDDRTPKLIGIKLRSVLSSALELFIIRLSVG
jgi:hypothetical protein